MKIYSNPNFPRKRPSFAAPTTLSSRRERIDTLTFVSELEARNNRALEQGGRSGMIAPTERVREAQHLTGPPIKIPGGGHVHAIEIRKT